MIFITPYSFVCTHTHTHHTLHTYTFQDYLSPVIPSSRGGAARTISAPEESMQWSIWSARPSYPGGVPRPVPPFSQSDPATSTLETLQLHHVRERQISEYSQLWPDFCSCVSMFSLRLHVQALSLGREGDKVWLCFPSSCHSLESAKTHHG